MWKHVADVLVIAFFVTLFGWILLNIVLGCDGFHPIDPCV